MQRGKSIWEGVSEAPGRKAELEVLKGCTILDLPLIQWEQNMFFSGARDTWLKDKTGAFPAAKLKPQGTHPVFVLEKVGNMACKICPCTSKTHVKHRYIVQGCLLQITERHSDRDSYILEEYTFNLPLDPAFKPKLPLQGKVPQTCIKKS